MSEVDATSAPPPRRPRLLWTLLGAMIIVVLVPLVVSHYFLIRINRDSLETLERKYLTRSAVGIATDIQNLLTNNTQQLKKIAGNVRALKSALPAGSDPFLYSEQSKIITDYITPDSDVLGLRIVNRAGKGAEDIPKPLDASVLQELDLALQAALKGQVYTGTFQYLTAANQPAVIMAVPVVDEGTVIGAIEAIVSLRRISERIRDEGKGDVTAFLVDRNGRVLLHSEAAVEVQHPDFSYLKIVQEFSKAPVRLTISYDDTRGGERGDDARHRRSGRTAGLGRCGAETGKARLRLGLEDGAGHDHMDLHRPGAGNPHRDRLCRWDRRARPCAGAADARDRERQLPSARRVEDAQRDR